MTKIILAIILFFQVNQINDLDVNKRVEKKIFKDLEILYGNLDVNILRLSLSEIEIYRLSKEQELGYLLLTSSIGKYDPFDFAIFLTTEGEISLVSILTYREDYGGEISNKKWLKQFIGAKNGNNVNPNDIQAISGATISVQSITHQIKEVLNKFATLQKKGLL